MLGGVCTACDCNPVGAVNASCTLPDGRCYCRENITNTRCNAPGNGFYARPLDFFIFEAEDANYPDVRSNVLIGYVKLMVVCNREPTRYFQQSVTQQILLD